MKSLLGVERFLEAADYELEGRQALPGRPHADG
jgi:hypothetical protein